MKKLLFLLLPVLLSGTAFCQNHVTIDVLLDAPLSGEYQLTGQSAFIQSMASSGTSGGQLDGVRSGAALIEFDEIFNSPPLEDYRSFSYFGRMQTLDDLLAVGDTSFVIALQTGTGIGLKVEDLFLYTESDLVAALGSFDSPEFLDLLNGIHGVAVAKGAFRIPYLGQPGETLDLIAFIGGTGGESGVKVGEISVTVVPEPTSGLVALSAFGVLSLLRRRV